MRLKALLLMTLITMMLLMNAVTIAFNDAPSAGETRYVQESDNYQTIQSANKDYTSYPAGLYGSPQSGDPEIQSARTETQGPNIFSLDSFVKDLSSHKVDEWGNLAYVDEDSAELVIGVNEQPEDHTKVIDLIVENGGKLVNTVSIKDKVIALVADLPLYGVSSFVAQVQASNLARYVEPNMKFQTQLVPNDPDWSWQWGPQVIEADWAWNTTTGKPSILVAVVDTGVDYDHPDLAANYVPLGYDWVNNDPDPMDDNGHGTHCAGIIAAVLNNGEGIAGVAQVKIMAEKGLDALGSGTEDDLANAIIYAVNLGADILSNSWGGSDSALIHEAVKYAYDNGVLVVAAAGNAASRTKLYPAAYDEVVAVTATDRDDAPAWFTSFGDWVEVSAPGVDIYSTVWDDAYTNMSGTSMSTPHVSGTAALIWSQFPNMTRDWVRAQLRYTADDLGDPGFDEYYGYGRINARKAVEWAPPDHDLLIYNWQRPKFAQPGDLVNFNVTVLNFGINDESNVTVHLLVDDNITDSESIGFLANGTLDTVSLLWNATFEGRYNVTVWVEPVPDEINIANNAMSVNINVQFIKIALVKNVDPWGYPANEEALDRYGVPYAVFGSKDFGLINITSFSKVIIASDQDQGFYNAMDTYRWWFEDYVSKGGMLEIHAADWGWNGGGWVGKLPGGLVWNSYYAQYVTIVDPTHPVVNIPNLITDAELDNWNFAVHGHFISYPPNSHIVIKEDSTGYPAYLEFDYGAGVIVASSQTLEWAYMRGYSLILENSLLYKVEKYSHELTVHLEAPAFLEPGNSTLLNATVYNLGLNNETNVELQLLIDGSIVNSSVIPELANGSSYTLSYLWTPPAEATYNVTAYAPPIPEEQFTFNNKMTRLVTVTYPLIRPIEGQWANYTLNYYDDVGRIIGTEYWNFTYDHYVEPYKIYITMWYKDSWGYIGRNWMIVNIMNRWVESGVWAGWWYPGWIETNITLGSTINLLDGKAIINASRIIPVGIYPIDCWEIPLWMYGYQYTFWYDKVSGLWISMEYIDPYYNQRQELLLVDTNIPIGTTYEHELAATLEAPSFLEPDDSSLLNATAYNIGLNTENNVKLSLIIDGTEVKSKIIPTLFNGMSYTISYLWTPTVEATYNVTAYVQPVPEEIVTVNNAATKMVRVRTVKGYVLFDQTHWTDPISGYSLWVGNLTDRGYVVDTLTVSPITPSALEGYDVFVIPQAHDYYSSSELTAIQDFVLNGGGLLVIGDDSPYIYSDLTRFAGITWDWGGYSGYTSDITPHPVTEGVNTAYFGLPMSRMFVSLPAQDIIRDAGKNIMLAVSEMGAGAVIGIDDEDSVIDWCIRYADNLRLANNMIDWLKSRRPIASFTYSPLDPYVGETVTFDASASYDPDGTIFSYLWDFGDHAIGDGVTTTHVYAAGGTYTVALTAIDNEGLKSTVTTEITVLRTTIDVQVKVGSIHFRGEIAEFYVLVSSLGKPIDANISAILYYKGNPYENLSTSVEHVSLGLYRIPYTIPLIASTGTYALVVEASYLTLSGISLESFLLSPTLTGWNALLVAIDGTVGTIKTDLGLIKVELNALNTTLVSVEGGIAVIDSAIGVIRTNVDTINGNIVAINGTIATINTVLGSITTDISSINGKIKAINETLATIQTTLGTLEVKLDAINATLVSIEGRTATINSTLGMIRTDVDTINANITTINGRIVTINSALGSIQKDISAINGRIITINGTLATIQTDIGMIHVNVNNINAKLTALNNTVATIQTDIGEITADIANIQLKVTAINGTIATIQTTLGTLEGRITSIEGDMATIETDIGTVKADISSVKEAQQAFANPLYVLVIPVLIIAIGAILLAFFMRRKS